MSVWKPKRFSSKTVHLIAHGSLQCGKCRHQGNQDLPEPKGKSRRPILARQLQGMRVAGRGFMLPGNLPLARISLREGLLHHIRFLQPYEKRPASEGLELFLACAGLRAFILRRCCAFGSVQVSEPKAAKHIVVSMFVAWCIQNHCKTRAFNQSQTRI